MPASARLQDQNGYLLVKGCPIASSGVFQYSAAQVGLPGDPNRIVNVYRPPEAVSDEEYLASLQLIPLINDHEMLSGFQNDNSATAPEDYGVDGVLYDVLYSVPWVNGDLKIFSRSMQADLSSGKKDLSLGYTCDFEVRSVVVDGVQCEVIQTNMRGNHIALVEVGRVPGARVLDGKRMCFDALSFSIHTTTDERGFAMAKPKVPRRAFDSNAAATVQALMKQLLPAFEQFMGEEAAEPAHQGAAAPAAGAGAATAAQPAAAAAAQPAAAAVDPNAAPAATAAAPAAGGETGTGEVAAEGASAGGAGDPNAATATGASAEGEEDEGGANLQALAQSVMQAIQAFCAAMPDGQAQAQPAAAAPAAAPAKKEGDDMGGEATGGESGAATGESNEETTDTIEGLTATVREGSDEGGDPPNAGGEGGQGTASAGPAAGKHEGADAALRNFYADLGSKNSLVDRLSKVVGAFDGALDLTRATASDVAAYGVTKLKLKCAKGQEVVALDAYLSGLEAARGGFEATPANPVPTQAVDSADDSVVSAYLKKVS